MRRSDRASTHARGVPSSTDSAAAASAHTTDSRSAASVGPLVRSVASVDHSTR